jgi:hypothetical protein
MLPVAGRPRWSVFPDRGVEAGDRIEKLAINFGAVGDRRAAAGQLWLAYPRPFRPGAIEVPLMTGGPLETFRRNADATPIRRGRPEWLYASGCVGPVKAELDLGLVRRAHAPACAAPPAIDGKLDDACWDGTAPLRFTTDEQAADERLTAFLRSDAENLYVGFRRLASRLGGKVVPWVAATSGHDAPVWRDDSLNIRLKKARGGNLPGLYLSLSASGARFDGLSHRHVGTDPQWNGDWRGAVHAGPECLTMEAAIPWTTMKEAKLSRENVAIYLESANRTGVGPERTQFGSRPFTRLQIYSFTYVPVSFEAPAPLEERDFRMVLHFVEPEALDPGTRVFDVKVQGRTVIASLDIARESGGKDMALTREIDGVRIADRLAIELMPRRGKPPVMCGLELYRR